MSIPTHNWECLSLRGSQHDYGYMGPEHFGESPCLASYLNKSQMIADYECHKLHEAIRMALLCFSAPSLFCKSQTMQALILPASNSRIYTLALVSSSLQGFRAHLGSCLLDPIELFEALPSA